MPFATTTFIFVFLPLSLILYFIAPKKGKNIILLLLSLLFYAVGGFSVIKFILSVTVFDYICGIVIAHTTHYAAIKRKMILAASLIGTCIPLLYFKYYNYAVENLNDILGVNIAFKELALPLGISFFTFKGISYLMDIYRKEINKKQTKSVLNVFMYMLFFPQVVSGPIEQYKNFQPQIASRETTLEHVSHGLWRIVVGLSKKIMIADILGAQVDLIWNNMGIVGIDTPTAWLGALLYMMQIYFDFSGYSDMALGLCEVFGFKFGENFDYPYISKSITEFWRRWHISLSRWFREYLYIPLGGNRRGNVYINLFIVFFVTGIWHGTANTFLIWGFVHGFFMILERVIKNKHWYQKVPVPIKMVVTNFIVMIGWVIFRAPTEEKAVEYLKNMFQTGVSDVQFTVQYYASNRIIFFLGIAMIACIPFWKNKANKVKDMKLFCIIKMVTMMLLLSIGIITMMNSNYSPNIYFQF